MIRALFVLLISTTSLLAAEFRAGVAKVDVTPEQFPVIVNCSFAEKTGTMAKDRLHARAFVLDDGTTRLAIVVVDSCMMPREFLDKTKELIHGETKIPVNRQLIAATHTHTAPAAMGCLGSSPDPVYGEFLQRQIVRAVRQATANLAPAKAGWVAVPTNHLTHSRRWILRADKVRLDPFGNPTVRANMHPGYQQPDFVGESGPIDPFLTLFSIRTADDKPLGVLANFSMHYFGSAPVSADYYGKFCGLFEKKVDHLGFVAAMSQGTSGDLHWMDYSQAKTDTTIDQYAQKVLDAAWAGLDKVKYESDLTLAMAETTLTLKRRTPDAERLAWAKEKMKALGDKKPTTQPDIYAREAVYMHDEPIRELKLQAVRIGQLGIAAIPNEVYGITGLKIKSRSPLPLTFNMELANGADGYIPTPAQHVLGGYTTWPARSAGLQVETEPIVIDTVLTLLEEVSGKKRRADLSAGEAEYANRILAGKPVAYWRLGELDGTEAASLIGNHTAAMEPGVVHGHLTPLPGFDGIRARNRAMHFAGGRVVAPVPAVGSRFSLECLFWSGVPEANSVVLALGSSKDPKQQGPEIRLVGGKLAGKGESVPLRAWQHVSLIRDGDSLMVRYADHEPITLAIPKGANWDTVVIGGIMDKTDLFEGRIAEVVLHDRPLTAKELASRRLDGGLKP